MRIDNCYFCGSPRYPSKGITFIRNDGKAMSFCKSKCHQNFKMKRNPRKVKWTKAFRKARGKEMVVDSTLQFAARRNVPIRYNRDHISTTLKAMERIREIKLKRERKHYKIRMANNKAIQRELDRKLVEENPHLLPRERASERLAREAEERVKEAEELGVEAMDTTVPIPIKTKQKRKQKLHLDGTIEESMDVD